MPLLRPNPYRGPAIALFLLAPVLPELLTGSTPLARFFNPLFLFLNLGLYGTSALLIREIARRRGLGWMSILLMGCAYGILEEGLWIQSFFNQHHWDLGDLAHYGRAWGVNWFWSQQITLVHAVWSICAPIALAEMLFPDRRHVPWLSRRIVITAVSLLTLAFLLGFAIFTAMFHKQFGYVPPPLPYLMTAALMAGLIWLALRWPRPDRAPATIEPPSDPLPAWRLALRLLWPFLLGFITFLGALALPAGFSQPPAKTPAIVAMLVLALWDLGAFALVRRWSGPTRAWDDRHTLALIAGPAVLFAIGDLLRPSSPDPGKNMSGQWLIGVLAVAALILLARRLRARYRRAPSGSAYAVPPV